MTTDLENEFIAVKTDHEGDFKVTISIRKGQVIYSEIMSSHKKEIILKGFSLKKHTVTISPIN